MLPRRDRDSSELPIEENFTPSHPKFSIEDLLLLTIKEDGAHGGHIGVELGRCVEGGVYDNVEDARVESDGVCWEDECCRSSRNRRRCSVSELSSCGRVDQDSSNSGSCEADLMTRPASIILTFVWTHWQDSNTERSPLDVRGACPPRE